MRAFIALELSGSVKKTICDVIDRFKNLEADVKWVEPENVHLTLKFLGDISGDLVRRIKKIMDENAGENAQFRVTLFKAGAFPGIKKPRTIWIGIDENCYIIEKIAENIDSACAECGIEKKNRQFSAHLTIGRIRSGRNLDALTKAILKTNLKRSVSLITELVLYESHLTQKGPIYRKLHTSRLKNTQ